MLDKLGFVRSWSWVIEILHSPETLGDPMWGLPVLCVSSLACGEVAVTHLLSSKLAILYYLKMGR